MPPTLTRAQSTGDHDQRGPGKSGLRGICVQVTAQQTQLEQEQQGTELTTTRSVMNSISMGYVRRARGGFLASL